MKPQFFLRLSLLLPYVLWAIMVLLSYIPGFGQETSLLGDTTEFLNIGFLAALFLVGILFWFLPYTLLAFGLWIWSRNNQVRTILQVFAISPLLLTALILLEVNILSIVLGDPAVFLSASNLRDLMSLNLVAIGLTLGAGYFCVAIGYGIYKLFQYLHIFKEAETAIQPVIHEAI
jgi:hypothetical protein